MLSILIPVYKYDCSALVAKLRSEAATLGLTYEILLGNDASGGDWDKLYQDLAKETPHLRVISAIHNLGAGRMRNRLAHEAAYPWLLIIDSDVMPARNNFLATYLAERFEDCVVCGGFIYDERDYQADRALRYVYGTKVEQTTASERELAPYDRFIAMAMGAPRELMLQCGFPEECGMGYEDALYGYRLKLAGIPVKHIDCPVVHSLKETSAEFLCTTRRYVTNLYEHRTLMPAEHIRLLNLYKKSCRLYLRPMLSLGWRILRKPLEKQLTSAKPKLSLFSLYKLLYLSSLGKC